jgi:mono/diheme cytochrome c family protein
VSKRNLAVLVLGIVVAIGAIGLYNYRLSDHVAEPTSGRAVYQRNCAGCHGVDGTGSGPAAEYLFPKPRDFTSGIYKFTSTPNGELPTDADIKRVIREGLNPGGMPGFEEVLTDRQIDNVTEYIKQFSDRFRNEKVPEPLKVPEPPENLLTDERVNRGKQLYDKFGCVSCHGENGEGNGPTADAQRDHWGDPVPPRDLTMAQYKSGQDIKDLYWRIMTGINGTGMPPYENAFQSEAQKWAMIAYVKSLSADNDSQSDPSQSTGSYVARNVDAPMESLKDPTAPVWETANRRRLSLYSLWLTDRTPFHSLRVRALHNEEVLAVRVSWNDPTHNVLPIGQTEFTDGVAVMFPNLTGAAPFIGMGEENMPGGVAHIWHWRAVDQFAVDRGGTTVDMEDKYPYMDVTYYKNKDSFGPGTQARYRGWNQYSTNQPDTFLTATAAGNTLGKQTIERPVRSYRAEGFGSLTALADQKMRVDGNGVYENGQWQVVMLRPLSTKTKVVQFEPGDTRKAAFAVWDGEQNDRNGQKDITSWMNLKLQADRTKTVATSNP